MLTRNKLAKLLHAAGTSLEEISEQAKSNAERDIRTLDFNIQSDEEILLATQHRLSESRRALAESREILKIASAL